MKICFIAPTGFGKTTAIKILKTYFDLDYIRIGEPLYELQKEFYNYLSLDIGEKQDGELLQFLGLKIRKESPDFLLNKFLEKIKRSNKTLILNDDCRPPDFQCLKKEGFIFVGIRGFRRNREDHIPIDEKSKVEWQEEVECDYYINNIDSLATYEKELLFLMKGLIKNKKMLHHTNSK